MRDLQIGYFEGRRASLGADLTGANTYTWDARNHLTAIKRRIDRKLRLRRLRAADEEDRQRHGDPVPLRWTQSGAAEG